jgi:pimeloyl-ACP methyl ester carboxylesterase
VEEFLQLIPHAEFVDVDKARHMVAGDRNDIFTAAVQEFLSRQRQLLA